MPGAEERAGEIEGRLKDQLRLKTNLGYRIEFYDYDTAAALRGQGKKVQGFEKGKTGLTGADECALQCGAPARRPVEWIWLST